MVDYYTSACFRIDVSAAEAAMLNEAGQICDALCHELAGPEDERAFYETRSEAFRMLFPLADGEAPFAAFRALFNDPAYPCRPADFAQHGVGEDGKIHLGVKGHQVDPLSLAGMLRTLCPSALPLCFGWANTASRACYDAYGGGYFEVRPDGIFRVIDDCEDIDTGDLVIAMRDPEEGLLFWNHDAGFGPLEEATVFTEKEASGYDLPIAHDQPEWIALPPRKAYGEVRL